MWLVRCAYKRHRVWLRTCKLKNELPYFKFFAWFRNQRKKDIFTALIFSSHIRLWLDKLKINRARPYNKLVSYYTETTKGWLTDVQYLESPLHPYYARGIPIKSASYSWAYCQKIPDRSFGRFYSFTSFRDNIKKHNRARSSWRLRRASFGCCIPSRWINNIGCKSPIKPKKIYTLT